MKSQAARSATAFERMEVLNGASRFLQSCSVNAGSVGARPYPTAPNDEVITVRSTPPRSDGR
jgi:hypothetical protein